MDKILTGITSQERTPRNDKNGARCAKSQMCLKRIIESPKRKIFLTWIFHTNFPHSWFTNGIFCSFNPTPMLYEGSMDLVNEGFSPTRLLLPSGASWPVSPWSLLLVWQFTYKGSLGGVRDELKLLVNTNEQPMREQGVESPEGTFSLVLGVCHLAQACLPQPPVCEYGRSFMEIIFS